MVFRPYLLLALPLACLTVALASTRQSTSGSQTAQNSSSATSKPASKAAAANTTTDANVYRNPAYGFRYNVILGWVDRTSEMQPEQNSADDSARKSESESAGAHGKVLLAMFERPPEVSDRAINSAVVIAEESAASYPGLKTAADYVGPLTELVTKRGFKSAGEPAEVTIDSKALVECDFTRESPTAPAYQTTLILLQKGVLVSFTFIGSSADEVKALIDRLSFQPSQPSRRPK